MRPFITVSQRAVIDPFSVDTVPTPPFHVALIMVVTLVFLITSSTMSPTV